MRVVISETSRRPDGGGYPTTLITGTHEMPTPAARTPSTALVGAWSASLPSFAGLEALKSSSSSWTVLAESGNKRSARQHLSPELHARALSAFRDAMPPGSTLVISAAFTEVHGLDGAAAFAGHPRYPLLYNSPLVVAVFRWAGVKSFLQRVAVAGLPTDGSDPLWPRTELGDVLEADFNFLQREALDNYWTMADDVIKTGNTTRLHSIESLALALTLVLAILASDKEQSRPTLARLFIKHLVAICESHCLA